jgi:hypothetical protein
VAGALTGCAHQADTVKVNCPTPPGSLLVAPERLPAIKPGPLSRQAAIKIWLEHIKLYELQRDRYRRLQDWGATQCEWVSK